MSTAFKVSQSMLARFKEPFGVLIEGSFSETAGKIMEMVEKDKPPFIVSVGDIVSRNLHKYRIIPQLSITDNRTMRKEIESKAFSSKIVVKVKNPPGTIAQEAIDAIRKALKSKKQVHIVVDGEEDLLTLIVVLFAPDDVLVVYGQPGEGLVAVKVTPEKREKAEKLWKAIKANKN